MRKSIRLCLIYVCLLMTLTGCKDNLTPSDASTEAILPTAQESIKETIPSVTASDLFQAQNPYLGDASAQGKLIGLAKNYYGITEKSTFELQTSFPPFGMTMHFEEEPEVGSIEKAAAVLMALTDRCVSVSWDYPIDEEGNKEYYYMTRQNAEQSAGINHLSEYNENEADFSKLLEQLEAITEPLDALPRQETIEAAVSAAILQYNDSNYTRSREVFGEGHEIMDTAESEDGTVMVYAQTMYGGYQFQNGNFVKAGGSGCTPVVIKLLKEPDGTYAVIHYQKPMDGSYYHDSIKKLFPEELWEACTFPSEEVKNSLKKQERSYAEEYLSNIGREAIIGDYNDFPYTISSDVGISIEVSNIIDTDRRYDHDSPACYAPSWFGNVERLEDGKRYLYEHFYDPDNKSIVFSKIDYETGEVLAKTVYDSETGGRR